MKRLSLYLYLVLIPCFLSSQNDKKIDSLLKTLNNLPDGIEKVNTISALYNAYLYKDINVAKKYANDELALSKRINFEKGTATSLYHLGVYYNNIDEVDSSKAYYTKSLKIFEKINDNAAKANVNHGFAILEYSQGNFKQALEILKENIALYSKTPVDSSGLAVTYVLRSGIYRQQGKYNIALKESLSAVRIYEGLDEAIRKADALGALAAIEFNLENFSESIKYNRRALDIYQEHNDQMYSAQAMNDIGNTYYYLEQYDDALKYLEMSLSLSKKVNSKDLTATALGNMGKVYTKLDKPEQAIFNFNNSIDLTKKSGNQYKTIESLNDLGIVYNKINKPKKAIPLFDEAITLGKNIEANQNLRISHFNKSKSYSKLNKYKLAFDEYKKFAAVSDSIFNTSKSKQIEELRTIYETEKKEQQILLQQNEISLLKQKGEINNLYKILFGIGFLLSLIGFYAVRQKLKHSRVEKEKLDLELDFKKKELTTHALHLAKKNEVLEGLKQQAKSFKASESGLKGYNQLIRTINFDLKDDNNWENFSRYFQEVHKDFNATVKQKFPELTPNELRLMSLLKMNLSSKEIANILNISQEGIKKARYRLRKKLNISTEESLHDLILKI
ncbi:tetratricopeptide repeat protein [Flavivirga algicola]|uniref:Tetratricopeptide repeat protein n=1 Tax=Flavivirga algicola TaxID=2729136 RepID=A0ABX1S0J4_9FLAO|nr:tetratricopeptide repeat protein [Flavivirga algicola]NMH89386.1 tetratricopeptide repeat protein [Flavivirga algicola]